MPVSKRLRKQATWRFWRTREAGRGILEDEGLMPESGKSKRAGRDRSRSVKDPRVDSTPPEADEDDPAEPSPSQPADPAGRIAALQASLERLRSERAADADQIAEMLVRSATVERTRAAAEACVADVEQRLLEMGSALDAAREDLRHREDELMAVSKRAEIAEKAASDAVEALGKARATLEAKHANAIVALRAQQAKALQSQSQAHTRALEEERREHASMLDSLRASQAEAIDKAQATHKAVTTSLRAEHVAAKRDAARLLEEERSAAARARQLAAATELRLAATRETVTKAASLLEELERREEMATALRTRALEQTRRTLLGDAPSKAHEGGPRSTPSMETPSQITAEPKVEVVAVENLELDWSDK
jgi:hypothetical protein